MALMTQTWTVAEYHRLVDERILDDQPVELLDGEIVVMPPEGEPHAAIGTDAATYRTEQAPERGVIHPLAFPDLAVSVSRLL